MLSHLRPVTRKMCPFDYVIYICSQTHNVMINTLTLHYALEWKYHFDEIVVDCTESCQFDKFQRSHWRQLRQNNSVLVGAFWVFKCLPRQLKHRLLCIWQRYLEVPQHDGRWWPHALLHVQRTRRHPPRYRKWILGRHINLYKSPYIILSVTTLKPLHWRHNGHECVSNHQPHDCLLKRLFRHRSKKTSKLRVTGLCVGNSPGTGE